jgi:acetate---CoA ligase (ADP-forming)
MSIKYFFNPKSVAIIGASRNPKKFGHVIFKNFLESDFKGDVYPINPKADSILGKKCFNSVNDLKNGADLAVITIPSQGVAEAVKDCVSSNVKASVIVSAGFAEVGNKEGEEALKALIKGKMRAIGPNVIGIYDSYTNVDTIFNLRYRQKRPPKGNISFISQSGAFGAAILDWAASENIGMSKFVSLGNMMDVDEVDMIEFLSEDRSTEIITVYLEGSKRPRKLYEVIKNSKKPIVILKSGKTKEGSKAVSSHTGSLAGESKLYSGLFRQSGAIEANNSEELFDYAKAFYQPLPKGNRVQIVTDGGGMGIMAADAVIKNGLALAQPTDVNKQAIKSMIPPYAVVGNIIDLTGDADSKRYENVLDIVMRDENSDIVLVILLLQISSLQSDIIDVLKKMGRKKTLVVCATGGEFTNVHKNLIEELKIPVYSTPERAIKAVKILTERKKYLEN